MRRVPALLACTLALGLLLAPAPWSLADPVYRLLGGDVTPAALESRTQSVASRLSSVTVRIDTEDGMGSGTIIDRSGLILTSAHVIEGCDKIEVCTSDRRVFRARPLGVNGRGDLALLKVDARFADVATFGDSTVIEKGSWVLASGHPTSAFDDGKPTLSIGRVHDIAGAIEAGDAKDFRNTLVSDVPLSAGSSGGGLFDLEGRLIAVNAAVTRDERRAFSVRIEEYTVDAERLRQGERFDRIPDSKMSKDERRRWRRGPSRRSWFDQHWQASPVGIRTAKRWCRLRLGNGRWLSAIHVSADGDLVSAASGFEDVEPGSRVHVRRDGESNTEAVFRGRDLKNGVAFLRLPPRAGGWPHFDLRKPAGPRAVGTLVATPLRRSVQGGMVASLPRVPPNEMRGEGQSGYWPRVTQCDLRLGVSQLGAPVVDRRGELVGMVLQHRLRLTRSRWEREPYGAFALPVPSLLESHQLLKSGIHRQAPRQGYFGVGLKDLTQGELRRRGLPGAARVAFVESGWPADLGGIRRGDLILAIGGKKVAGRADAIDKISGLNQGRRVTVTLYRAGRRVHCFVEAGDRRRRPAPKPLASFK